jgi:LacI family transcriptional regulator
MTAMAVPPTDRSIPTLADVARRANVSTATVSRCLNSPDQVVGETRERVMKAVAELGYAPNFGARALAAKQTNTVGAIIPTMENAVFARGIQAFQEELGRHGKTLLIASSAYQAHLEEEQVRALVARGADALLLIGYDRSPDLYAFLKKRAVPTLVAWSYAEGRPARDRLRQSRGDGGTGASGDRPRAPSYRLHLGAGGLQRPCARPGGGHPPAMTEAGLDAAGLTLIETPYAIENGETAFRRGDGRCPGHHRRDVRQRRSGHRGAQGRARDGLEVPGMSRSLASTISRSRCWPSRH